MGRFLAEAGPTEHAFLRVCGPLPPLDDDLAVITCSHDGLDGQLVTEALVSGRAAARRVAERCRLSAEQVVVLHDAEWVTQCILAASGSDDLASPGMLGIFALRAPKEEWHLVSHPRAPSAVDLLARMSRCFDRWIQL